MRSKHMIVRSVVTVGLIIGGAATCFAQSDTPTIQERPQQVAPGTEDRVLQDRTIQRERMGDRTVVKERVVERRREGETYVSGFGGFTWGHTFDSTAGTGTLKGAPIGSQDLANSVVYGGKIGYFFPERYNWLGVEAEAFNTTPHMQEGPGLIGSHLRVTTLAFNVIARTKLGCKSRDHDSDTEHDAHDSTWSALRDNERCPVQLYGGVGPGIFFAETSNQFGRSSDTGRVGLNALAGAKYFLTRHVALFGEYKFNYADFDFSQAQGQTAGVNGNYSASHVVGGLSWHW